MFKKKEIGINVSFWKCTVNAKYNVKCDINIINTLLKSIYQYNSESGIQHRYVCVICISYNYVNTMSLLSFSNTVKK